MSSFPHGTILTPSFRLANPNAHHICIFISSKRQLSDVPGLLLSVVIGMKVEQSADVAIRPVRKVGLSCRRPRPQ
jgi:hypothetical protein